jgi:prepilin-type processing-associated H-X9-DG protein
MKGQRGLGDYLLTTIGESKHAGGPDWALSACASATPGEGTETRSGESWFLSGHHFTLYNHCAPPNAKAANCSFLSGKEPLHNRTLHEGVFSASSQHPGGVNVLLMDGSQRFLKNKISMAIWRALATRSGGEVVSVE